MRMFVLKLIRRGHLGHIELVLEARFGDLERCGEREDLMAVLDRNHAARGEAGAVAAPVDFVEDRHLGIAPAQEIRVERVALAAFDRTFGRDQGLAQHLSAEHALHAVVGALTAEDVDLDLLEVEKVENLPDRGLFGIRHRVPLREGLSQVQDGSPA